MRSRYAALALGLAMGCGSTQASDGAPGTDLACPLRLSVRAEPGTPRIALFAELTNQSSEAMTVELQTECGVGAARFSGVRDGYDFAEACAAGDCASDAPRRVSLEPGRTTTIAYGTIDPSGGTCNEPVPAGTYPVTFTIRPVGDAPRRCGPTPVDVLIP